MPVTAPPPTRPATPPAAPRPGAGRHLSERVAGPTSPLEVDRARGVIFGVKVIGRFSKNSHGVREAENGTEYSEACLREAVKLYEGVNVLTDHAAGRGPRSVRDALGVLRNVRAAPDGLRADLHFNRKHPIAEQLCEDVESGLGQYGLSHDATSGRDRIDTKAKRLVVEAIASVRSVDLVLNPATNRNLWESHREPAMPQTTLRKLLEGVRWHEAAARLLEMDDMPGMDAPVDAPPAAPPLEGEEAGPDHEAALTAGFEAAIMAAWKSYLAGEMTVDEMLKKAKDYAKSHSKLTAGKDPGGDGEAAEEADGEDADDAPPDKGKKEQTQVEELQKKVRDMEHREATRLLCEQNRIAPDRVFLEAINSVPLATARKLIEREKARGSAPRSSPPPRKQAAPRRPSGDAFLEAISE